MKPLAKDGVARPTDGRATAGSSREARVWVGPAEHSEVLHAIVEAGGVRRASVDDANVIIWCTEDDTDASLGLLDQLLHPGIEWVQLDAAGVDDWFRLGLIDGERTWTRADYGPAVAEQVMGFLLAACRRFPQYARTTEWAAFGEVNLAGQTVGFLGAGRIVAESVARLKPFGAKILTLSDPVVTIEGVDAAYSGEHLSDILKVSDHVVLALPLTDRTRGMIGSEAFEQMRSTAWLHNVGRGQIVDTNALLIALTNGQIAGACLDTTDPEPLPPGHPLWKFNNVLLTQHTANPKSNTVRMYAACVGRNVKRFGEGVELSGVVDIEQGY